MFDTDSETLRDDEPTVTETPKASAADSAADAAKKAADAEKREKRRARQKRQAFTEQMQNLTMDDIQRRSRRRQRSAGRDRAPHRAQRHGVPDEGRRRVRRRALERRLRTPRGQEGVDLALARVAGREAATGTRWRPFSCRDATPGTPTGQRWKASGNARAGHGRPGPASPRCTPVGVGSYRIGVRRDIGHAPARQTPAAIGHAGYSHPVITSSATSTCRHLSVGIHMTLLLIAENNLYGRDGIRAGSDLQHMDGVRFTVKGMAGNRNADDILTSDDRCKAV